MSYDTDGVSIDQETFPANHIPPGDMDRVEAVLRALPDVWHAYQRRTLKQKHFQGVTPGQVRVLSVLMHEAPCSVSTVANALNISMGASSESVDRLVDLGYISREHSTTDRRRVILDLTPRAREIADHVRRVRIAQIAAVFQQMTPEERDGFVRGLHLYRDVLATAPIVGPNEESALNRNETEEDDVITV